MILHWSLLFVPGELNPIFWRKKELIFLVFKSPSMAVAALGGGQSKMWGTFDWIKATLSICLHQPPPATDFRPGAKEMDLGKVGPKYDR